MATTETEHRQGAVLRVAVVPPLLRRGDRVALVATARKVTPEETAPAVALLRQWGLEVEEPEGLYAECNQYAGDDSHRAALLQRALDDEGVRAVLCCRGGYGTVRIVDRIDFAQLSKHPKWIVGYSDVTVLHSHVHRHCNMATLHATMPLNIPADATARRYDATESLREALFEGRADIAMQRHALNRTGTGEGELVGGNLSILYSLCGSASDIVTDGKILFIEDLDEYLYHIDRMMQNLKRTGKLSRLSGLVVGALSDMHDNAVPYGKTAEEIVREAVEEYDYPVAFGAPCGHIGTKNKTLMLGGRYHLTANETGATLSLMNLNNDQQ